MGWGFGEVSDLSLIAALLHPTAMRVPSEVLAFHEHFSMSTNEK